MTKETGCRPCVLAHTYEILHPQPALCAILGVWVPLTSDRKSKCADGDEKEGWTWRKHNERYEISGSRVFYWRVEIRRRLRLKDS
jgi:hypothetical protein